MSSGFLGSLVFAAVCSLLVLVMWVPPVVVLLGNIAFYIAFSMAGYLASKSFFIPSAVLSVVLCVLLAGIVLYPRILAMEARTPQEHFIAAESLDADWRIPFQDETAAWPHYVAAAEGGIAVAQCAVGAAYLTRQHGLPFDRAKARYWFESAALHGSVAAQRELKDIDTVPEP